MSDPSGQNSNPADAQSKAAEYQKMQNDAPMRQVADSGEAQPGSEPSVEPTEDQPPRNLEIELAAALSEAEKNKEAMLRLAADIENLRRRSAEEVSKAHKFAIESFAETLLPVRDSLETAISLENQSIETLKEGVAATLRLLENSFERGRIQVLDPTGQKFDPNQHQAVSMVPGSSSEPPVASGHIVAVMQKGYLINERVLRPALVVVAQ